jgi:G3E family GTPase
MTLTQTSPGSTRDALAGLIPVSIVTGFLGSGKTTLVNRLLSSLKESLVIVNEFGEIPVDHYLLESAEERTVALPNGCLCCHLRGDLEETLVDAAMRRRRGDIAGFDRVIVETSGIADPGPIAQTLYADQSLARDFKLGSIVTVVDTADAGGRRLAGGIARAQIAAADVVVLSKSDRATDSNVRRTEDEVRNINPHAQRIAAVQGNVDSNLVFSEARLKSSPAVSPVTSHPSSVRSFVLRFDNPVERGLLERFLATLVELRGADLLRVKGTVPLSGGEAVLVQGVRHVFDRLRAIQGSEPGLVFITSNVEEEDVRSLWRAMESLHGRKQ